MNQDEKERLITLIVLIVVIVSFALGLGENEDGSSGGNTPTVIV
ncbi:hypothetical protein Q5741_16660 [Paenibacillus sp. JX-17]|uniref:Uncharacterized protein n=1 Tax=Paenibacillus lacisoli TaxID=3064525 RepID=A0ABT9CFJ1_9BACL|nr:hypothetical protein [Paenibacillus sp. JX-17]MDO7908046.1 hypothetical protein [Paenibacillus sp. JX-17]